MLAVLAAVAVGGCGASRPPVGEVGNVVGFAGAVAADEPRAVLVARDVLSSGGTAADAAVALAFTMAVTNPSSAGLGGGGVCLVHDHKGKKTEALEFFAGSDALGPKTTRATAVPAMPRGMYALHSRYGRLRWESLLVPAENLARQGETVSRSLATDLSMVAGPLLEDPEARKVLGHSDGSALKEGERIVQLDLAAMIGRVRSQGPGSLYVGSDARILVEAVAAAGGSLTLDGLRKTTPRWTETLQVRVDNTTAHFAPPPAAGGMAGQAWAMLNEDEAYRKADADVRDNLLVETAVRAVADRGRWMQPGGASSVAPAELVGKERIASLRAGMDPRRHVPVPAQGAAFTENPAAAGFVVADAEGSAVACTLTMNNQFGAGRIAPGTGILLAAAAHPAGRGPYALAPMLLVKHNVNEVLFAATASGGGAAVPALMGVAAQTVLGGGALADAVAAPRAYAHLWTDAVYVEQTNDKTLAERLEKMGHRLGAVNALGRVNAISCPEGLPPKPDLCRVATDPRGSGYAVISGKD